MAAIVRKEFRHIRRDPLSLGLLVFVPALLLVLYGYALSFDVRHIRVAVLDYDRTTSSRLFLDSLFGNAYFDRGEVLDTPGQADACLKMGRARAVLIIPKGFAADLRRGAEARVQALVDGSDANTASTTVGYLDAVAMRGTARVRVEAARRGGGTAGPPAVVPRTRVWFNEEMESAKFLVPGLVGMLMMLSAVVATALSIVREKERRTMEQIMVSAIRPWEFVVGKTVPYVLICLLTMVLILALARVLFGVAVQGSYGLLGAATLLFIVAALSMGVLISTVTDSQQMAFQIAVIASLLPSIILSGLIFPIRNMPWPIQALTCAVVPRFFVATLRAIILKGAPFSAVWGHLAAMLGLGFLFAVVAVVKTRKAV